MLSAKSGCWHVTALACAKALTGSLCILTLWTNAPVSSSHGTDSEVVLFHLSCPQISDSSLRWAQPPELVSVCEDN